MNAIGAIKNFLPILWAIIKRGKGLADSTTTKAQYGVLLAAGVLVAAVGYFVPALAANEVAMGLMLAILPVLSRLALLKQKQDAEQDLPPASATIWLVKVDTLTQGDESWIDFSGTILDAKLQGHRFGVDEYGNVWDATSGVQTGEAIRLNSPESPEEIAANQAKFAKWLADARERIAQKSVTK